MDIGPITSRRLRRALGGLCLWSASTGIMACPFDTADPLLGLRSASDLAIVKISTLGRGQCNTVGTGFFISPAGHILTAGHVVPLECDNDDTTVEVRWSKAPNSGALVGPFKAKVVARSSLDVLVLALSDAPDASRQFLRPSPRSLEPSSLKNSCVLLPSHYYEQTDTYSTFAEIASVSLDGDKRWALSGEGFNPSRSGSPVVVRSGQVAAIFVARPVNPSDRANTLFSRAYVLPLANIPSREIDVEGFVNEAGLLNPFLTPNANTAANSNRVRTSFGLSVTEPGFRTNPPFFFEKENGDLSPAPDSLLEAGMRALREKYSLVGRVRVKRDFKADPGYAFDHKTIDYRVASMNPRNARLPKELCDDKRVDDCVALTANRSSMQLRFFLYPGIDGRNSWVDAEVDIAQVAQ